MTNGTLDEEELKQLAKQSVMYMLYTICIPVKSITTTLTNQTFLH